MKFQLPKGRYLVSGGAGFIGSHLSEVLIENGCEVVVVDNFITGRPQNIKSLLGRRSFSLVEQDLVSPLKISGQLAGIFHLASPASPVDYAKFPIETLHVGAIGSDNILKLAQEKDCPILVASTSEVYGDPLQHPQQETYWGNVNPIGPRGCYDESKRYMEALTMAYRRVHHVRTRIARIFNTYGPRMRPDDGRVVPNFCKQALANEPVTVFGDGMQTRSFCFVDDLVGGLVQLMGSDHAEPINLGNPQEMTINQFAEKIIRFCKSQSKIQYLPLPQDDPKTRCPDITLAKSILHWEPRVDLDLGLEKTVEYFRTH
ncbi:MAG: SDR family oxidoreductase [Proteobacteria bacterium]|nr:SDR family oxidoreductase [Pseudomonadota bacterium]